jgi:formylglycine-generating enzyme required for sulfatase activity
MQFCRKLTERERSAGRLPEGYEYALPTEAQWEYACRAGTTGDYAGNLDAMAWYDQNSSNTTHPVAQKQANAWGLYDMHGNVWEWCRDWYDNYPGGSVSDPTGPSSGEIRVFRGGGWCRGAGLCRSDIRLRLTPDSRFDYLGFRVSLAPQAERVIPNAPANVRADRTAEGQAWTVPDLNLEMAYIRPGTFTMGNENGDSNEKPLTRVTLTRAYWLGKTEVTQGQYEALMGNNPSNFKNAGRDAPVETVSWDEAMQFCRKLTERERQAGRLPEGYEYTLPTEAQWEYACRAGTTGDYAGNLAAMAWYSQNCGDTTHAVGQKQANAWGLYDMHGNVWEWCRDWYGSYPGGSGADPTGPSSGAARVFRGGSWDVVADYCRSAFRLPSGPGGRSPAMGFRLALAPVPSP